MPNFAIFSTQIGWIGLVGSGRTVHRLVFGHSSQGDVWSRLTKDFGPDFEEADWHPELREALEAYAAGEHIDFCGYDVDLSHLTPFQHRVIRELRTVSYGEKITYAELAVKAGSPKAARAVGSVMAQNRVPLIIPCHRVVGSGGNLGGFSAPRGLSLKQELLDMESQCELSAVSHQL